MNFLIYQTNLSVPSFLMMKTLKISLGLKTLPLMNSSWYQTKYWFPYQTKVLVSSSNFIMDLANSFIFSSFQVYLQLLNCWNLSISDVCSSSKFEFKTFLFKYLAVSNYIAVRVTLQLHYSCILWKVASLKRKEDLLKDLNDQKQLLFWNCFKTALSLRRNR